MDELLSCPFCGMAGIEVQRVGTEALPWIVLCCVACENCGFVKGRPIENCGHVAGDGTCKHPDNMTPECHDGACPLVPYRPSSEKDAAPAEPCDHDAAGWCATHTRDSSECRGIAQADGDVGTFRPAPAEPTCARCGKSMSDHFGATWKCYRDMFSRVFEPTSPAEKPCETCRGWGEVDPENQVPCPNCKPAAKSDDGGR